MMTNVTTISPWGELERGLREVPILAVAERLGLTLKKRGMAVMTHCLWHEDSRPSMLIGGRYNRCHCFSCDKDSDAVGLVMQALGTDFKGACEWLVNETLLLRPHPNPLQRRWGKDGKTKRLEDLQAKVKSHSTEKEFNCFRKEFLEGKMTTDNSFVRCMRTVFGEDITIDIMKMYQLGSLEAFGRYPDVMFPNIDINGNIHDIKIQAYECDERSERFFHSQREICYWLKSSMLRRNDIDKEKVFQQIAPPRGMGGCLFGEHLLCHYPSKIVVLVESPKNACVGAAQYPEYLWLATGNKGMLKREILEVLHERDVIVIPDNDAYDEWAKKLETMRDIANFACIHTPGDNGEKGDIADWIIREKVEKVKSIKPSPITHHLSPQGGEGG